MNTLRLLPKVTVLFSASDTGSPSPSTSTGYASTSSSDKNLIGIIRKPAALFAPLSTITPPGYSLDNTVFPLSFSLAGVIRSSSTGVSLIAGASLCFDRVFARSTVGSTIIPGPGH